MQEDVLDPLADARDMLDIGESIDPLEALLNCEKRIEDVRDTIKVTLHDGSKTLWTVKPITQEAYGEAEDRCTQWVKTGRGGTRVQETNQARLSRLVCELGVTNPPLANPKLLTKYGVTNVEALLPKILLPGVIDSIAAKVLETSGFKDGLVEAGKV